MIYKKLELEHAQEVVHLFYNTFKASENEQEAIIVSGLVKKYLQNFPRKDLKGYIAIDKGKIVGCVFFSQLFFLRSYKTVFILSPMAVKTEYHGRGIGQALINYAHKQLIKENVNLTITYGDINFYSKVGYEQITESKIAAPMPLTYPEGWLGCSLDAKTVLELEGSSSCIPELNDKNLW